MYNWQLCKKIIINKLCQCLHYVVVAEVVVGLAAAAEVAESDNCRLSPQPGHLRMGSGDPSPASFLGATFSSKPKSLSASNRSSAATRAFNFSFSCMMFATCGENFAPSPYVSESPLWRGSLASGSLLLPPALVGELFALPAELPSPSMFDVGECPECLGAGFTLDADAALACLDLGGRGPDVRCGRTGPKVRELGRRLRELAPAYGFATVAADAALPWRDRTATVVKSSQDALVMEWRAEEGFANDSAEASEVVE